MLKGLPKKAPAFYQSHVKFFKMDGTYSQAYKAHNGILQGCPLSMLVLTSLMTAWVEQIQKVEPEAVPRTFANDVSACVQHRRLAAVRTKLRKLHD